MGVSEGGVGKYAGVQKYVTKGGQTRWRIRWEGQRGPNGERRRRSRRGFTTETQARQALREELARVDDGTAVDTSKHTVASYLTDEWLPSIKPRGTAGTGRRHRGQVSLTTWETYGHLIRAHIAPAVGGVRLQALTPKQLDDLYDHLEDPAGKGLSPKSVANVHGVVHKALADAVKRGLVVRNIADAVSPPKAAKPRTEVWDVPQLRRFLGHVESDRLYAMWLLFATTGMRRGEVAGLTWDDVDLDTGRLRVEWTLGLVEAKPTWKLRPKSDAGERTMALDPATVDALRSWRARQAEERLAMGPGWVDDEPDHLGTSRTGVVFTWPDGRIINPERISSWFGAHVEAAALPRIRLHDLRHTYATAALASADGWGEVKVVSERLGHASVGVTLDTYSHVLPAADERTAHTLARLILEG